MTNTNDPKGKKGGMSMSNTTAGAMGAVVGGMVGAAAGIALSDKAKRKMLMQKMDELKKYVTNALDEIQEMSQDTTDMISEKTPVTATTVKKVIKRVKKGIN